MCGMVLNDDRIERFYARLVCIPLFYELERIEHFQLERCNDELVYAKFL